jgi:hypothetical protein
MIDCVNTSFVTNKKELQLCHQVFPKFKDLGFFFIENLTNGTSASRLPSLVSLKKNTFYFLPHRLRDECFSCEYFRPI